MIQTQVRLTQNPTGYLGLDPPPPYQRREQHPHFLDSCLPFTRYFQRARNNVGLI